MTTARWAIALVCGACACVATGCGSAPRNATNPTTTTTGTGGGSAPAPTGKTVAATDDPALWHQIPAAVHDEALRAHLKGLGHMERMVEYPQAVEQFRKVHELAPRFIPGSINLAIALLNTSGKAAEEAKKADGAGAPDPAAAQPSNFDEALALLDDVIQREPKNPHAHYCRGVILEYLGRTAEAHADYEAVNAIDPEDAQTWYHLGSTLPSASDATLPAGPPEAARLIELYTRALERNPNLVSAMFKLQAAYAWSGQRDKQKELLARWQQLDPSQNPAGPGEKAELVYGSMGPYATIQDWSARRDVVAGAGPESARPSDNPPRFETPQRITASLPDATRWVKAGDFIGNRAVLGRARNRFGAGITVLDIDGDNALDLYLPAALVDGEGHIHDALLRNLGDGRFEEVGTRWGLPGDRASLAAAAGDFDADGRVDLYLTGIGSGRLLHNLGDHFEDVTEPLQVGGPPALSIAARWLDLDQDGDLDLYVVNHCPADQAEAAFGEKTPPGLASSVYRNDGKPAPVTGRPPSNWAPRAVAPPDLPSESGLSLAFTPWPDAAALTGGSDAHTGIAWLDVDEDRDLDVVLVADGAPTSIALNDRLGVFRAQAAPDIKAMENPSGVLVTETAGATPALVVVPRTGRLAVWQRNAPGLQAATESASPARGVSFGFWPTTAHDWRSAQAIDLDLDGRADLLGLPATEPAPEWAHHTGKDLAALPLSLGDDSKAPLAGLAAAPVVGDPLPDLVLLRDGEGPFVARNLGNGNHWLALDPRGRWKASFDRMRTNPHALGAEFRLQAPALNVVYRHTTRDTTPGQSVMPFVLGMGPVASADLVRVTWPDGVMQCELNQAGDVSRELVENNRKTGSCPVLFTFDGERFVCLGDFLGGGGLGYLVAPGVHGQPDRDEAMAIAPDQLRAVGGRFRISVTEPMDEVAYLDRLVLEAIDRPADVAVGLDERFAPGGNRPTGALLAWKRTIEPVHATDLNGRDLTATLRAWDRQTADQFARLGAWVGYTEEHGIVLDFGDRLRDLGPGDRVVLALAGWVEYPYSQTNYAAATAGVPLQPPVLERLQADGTWTVLESDPGYPAGLPRLTTLELTGKLAGERCVLRLRTNMECYYDQAYLAVLDPTAEVRTTALEVATAVLGPRGYTREVSPDGKQPLVYDYDYVDPAPLARLAGKLTRLGDVAPLLKRDDDQLCLVGPGDEVRVEFDATALPPLPEGWTRSYVLRSYGYCKDADPFTAASDTVGPLPWNGMGPYPFGPDGERPRDPAYDAYLKTFHTREVGSP